MTKTESCTVRKANAKVILIVSAKGSVGKTTITYAINSIKDKKINTVSFDVMNKVLPGTEGMQISDSASFKKSISDASKNAEIVLVDVGTTEEYSNMLGMVDDDKGAFRHVDLFVVPALVDSLGETENTVLDLVECGVDTSKIKILPNKVKVINRRKKTVNINQFKSVFTMCDDLGVDKNENHYLMDCFGLSELLLNDIKVSEAMKISPNDAEDAWLLLDEDQSAKKSDVDKALNRYRMVSNYHSYINKPQFTNTINWLIG